MVILGAGSPLVPDLEESCRLAGIRVTAIIRGAEGRDIVLDASLLCDAEDIPGAPDPLAVLCPMFNPGKRQQAYDALAVTLGERRAVRPQTVIDQTAIVPLSTSVGAGTYINAGVVIGAASTFGACCLINRGAVLGHHLAVEDFVSIGPGAVVQGDVTIGRGAMIGTNATVREYVSIGRNAAVGAGAVVLRDVPDNTLVVGNPARFLRRIDGYQEVPVR